MDSTDPGPAILGEPACAKPTSSLWLRLGHWLGASEVDADPRLRLICAALLYYFHMTFFDWWRSASALSTKGTETANYVPFFLVEHLRWLIFLNHAQTKMVLFGLGMLALMAMFALFYLRDSTLSLVILAFLWIMKLYYYWSDLRLFANFHHLHLIYTLAFLISPAGHKLFFFRITLVVSYLMSGLIKLTPSWLFGEYFNSIPGKLPLLPQQAWFVRAAQQGIIVLELVLPWFWFMRWRAGRLLVWGLYILFHLYSGVLVGFKYTTLMMPLIVGAFLDFDQPIQAGYRFQRRDLAPWLLQIMLLTGAVYHFLIPGDARLTHEGKYFGVFMFDANRQVDFRAEIVKGDRSYVLTVHRPWRNGAILEDGSLEPAGEAEVEVEAFRGSELTRHYKPKGSVREGMDRSLVLNPKMLTSAQVRTFGDPYLYYFFARELCERYQPDHLRLEMWEQLDGHTERVKLMDIQDFCQGDYRYNGWGRNSWILLPTADAPASYLWW